MRSRNERLQFSNQLGRKFSANGDMLVMAYGLEHEGNAVADEIVDPRPPGRRRPGRRAIGPTITEMLDLRNGHADTDLVIQDLAVPGPLRRLFEETTTTFDILNGLAGGDWKRHETGPLCCDDAAVNPDAIKKSLVLAMICRDDAEGELRLNGPTCDDADGLLTVSWPQLRLDRRFEAQHSRLRDLLQKSKLGGRVVNNLLWRPLSEDLEDVFGRQRGPLVTVHPLGGCAMGDSASHGVTDDCGRVFDVGKGDTYFGLVVLDGSIVPSSLGINPALTISVLALQALGKLKECWGIEGGRLDKKPQVRKERGLARPIFWETETNSSPNPTLIELTEQVRGHQVKLSLPGVRPQRHEIEITLTTQPKEVATLFSHSAHEERCLIVPAATSEKPAQGRLRILKTGIEFDPVSDEPCQAGDVALEAEISGKLKIFALEQSHPFWRTFRVFFAWLFNRGLRDIVQGAFQRIGEWLRLVPRRDEEPKMKLPFRQQARSWLKEQWDWIRMNEEDGGPRNVVTIMRRLSLALLTVAAVVSVPVVAVLSRSICYTLLSAAVVLVVLFAYRQRSYILKMFGLFSRAGAVRLIEYDLHIDKVVTSNSGFEKSMFEGHKIRGVKRLTYALCASPFTQLMVLSLEKFPGMRTFPGKKLPEMELNKRYLARQEVPLLRVVGQENGFASLVDMVSFAFYLVRVVLQVHALSFRKPDAPSTRPHQRLPVAVLGLPTPQIDWLTVAATTKPPARIRLARYDGSRWEGKRHFANEPQRPVLLIHGYSASGTTFVHHTVPGNLVQVLCEHGRDVWVLDLRSSAGLDTATADWTFEMMANQDIPAALGHVLAATGSPKGRVDVVAHCMGAAMLGMALLEDPDDPTKENCLHKKIGRVVFSQVGPAMLLSRTNVLAAYVMRYVRDLLPLEEYTFSPQGEISTAGQFLDRVLATMSMPPYEFRRENPWWPGKATPWVGTRHRMDALYGRTFRLKNMASATLDHIDDFFGPLSVDTVSQVLHFAAVNCVTDNRGINRYVTPERVANRLKFPMMSLHGEENGLSDPATMAIMRNMLSHSGVPYLNDVLDTKPSSKDRVAQISSFEEITELIDDTRPHLVPGKPSYLTWLIEAHGHQDCLIGKDARRVCEVIAHYLGIPDPPPPAQSPAAQSAPAIVPVSAAGGIS
jgi:pimeloyl-ACP methyl ester carboxylesterase